MFGSFTYVVWLLLFLGLPLALLALTAGRSLWRQRRALALMALAAEQSRLTTMGTARPEAALEMTYGVRLRRADGAESLVTDLNGLEGVRKVELRAA